MRPTMLKSSGLGMPEPSTFTALMCRTLSSSKTTILNTIQEPLGHTLRVRESVLWSGQAVPPISISLSTSGDILSAGLPSRLQNPKTGLNSRPKSRSFGIQSLLTTLRPFMIVFLVDWRSYAPVEVVIPTINKCRIVYGPPTSIRPPC